LAFHKRTTPPDLPWFFRIRLKIEEEVYWHAQANLLCGYFFLDKYNTMYYNRFMEPKELRKWREDRGLPRRELAAALGVHLMALAYWEWGKRRIPPFLHLALKTLDMEFQKGVSNGTFN
jgi:DNA-binding XRE family transcriptional regulator